MSFNFGHTCIEINFVFLIQKKKPLKVLFGFARNNYTYVIKKKNKLLIFFITMDDIDQNIE
jgi:hypothetical protein